MTQYLVAAFLSLLGSKGLAPETLDTWHGWPAFKEFARATAETPDPGVSGASTGPIPPSNMAALRNASRHARSSKYP